MIALVDRGRRSIVLAGALAVLASGEARAQLLDLSGSLDVSAVQTDIGDREEESFRQQYVISAWRSLSDYLDLRASLRYFSFDVDSPSELGLFREEIQPSAELGWRHPWFHLNSSVRRRVATSLVSSGDLINENLSVDWRTVRPGLPILSLRYDWQTIEDTSVDVDQKLEDERLQAGIDIERKNENIGYVFSHRRNENLIRGLTGTENAQQFRYLGSYRPGTADRWRVLTQYYYNRRDRTDEVRTGRSVLEVVPVARGLFDVDASPDQGELGSAPGLIDGNTLVPAAPTIDIGAGALDRNLGADLGLIRDAVSAVFVYTDRLAGAGTSWTVYVSDDGINWSLHTATPRAEYFAVQQRFEIVFEPVATRYVKAVNGGANEVVDVLVTELQVLEELPVDGEIERDTSSHLASTQVNWQATRALSLLLDTSGRIEPGQGTVEDRKSVDYAVRLDWRPEGSFRHTARAQQGWQFFRSQGEDLRDDVASYSLFYEPLPTLSASTTAGVRRSTVADVIDQELLTWLVETNARPLPSVYVVVEGLLSRLDQPEVDSRSDSWQMRTSTDLDVTRNFSVLLNWLHRETRITPVDELRIRRSWAANFTLQLTPSLFARAGLTWLDDLRFSRRQDYVVSWLLGTRLTASGQIILEDSGSGSTSDRHGVNLALDLTSRATLYASYSRLDQRSAGGERTESWQQGLRMSF
jgi:hypothetical protein